MAAGGTNLNKLKQSERMYKFHCALGDDVLLVSSFNGTESISKPFEFQIELVSDDFNIDFMAVIGKPATLAIRLADGQNHRYISGYISRFRQIPHPGRLAYYQAELVPWMWFLGLVHDCYIYQDKKVPDVIEDVFQRNGWRDYEFKLYRNERYEPWEYLTQYRETSLAFVCRLMEIEGLYFFHTHEKNKHTLIITDDKVAHKPCPHESAFRYEKYGGPGGLTAEDAIHTWDFQKSIVPNKFTHKEYHHDRPDSELLASKDLPDQRGADRTLEVYDYPGAYEKQDEGDRWSNLRAEEENLPHIQCSGTGSARALTPGFKFDMAEHVRREFNSSYLITSIQHTGQDAAFIAGSDTSQSTYANSFECLPADVQYRPIRSTPEHLMTGSQTAEVVGPSGEEIYTDEQGRVKVKFHWDRKGQKSQGNTSCWIRVARNWTGAGFGEMWIPRVGHEVIVDFLEGDPDRPIITGMVYNAKNMPPWKLPDHKTRSGVRTQSSRGKIPEKCNELRFEDKTGEEHVYLHAEKDLIILVENDTRRVEDRDNEQWVGRHQKIHIHQDSDLDITGSSREQVKDKKSVIVGGDHAESAQGTRHIQADGDIVLQAQGKIVLKAQGGLVMDGGANFVSVDSGGVTIQGTMVYINSSKPNMVLAPMPPSPDQAKRPEKPAEPKGKGYLP
jgi:type VI secretion system secreted protein VgrG